MQPSSGHLSDVARIRQQIELETMSMVHAQMFAVTASHDIINAKFKSLDTLTNQLAEHMPQEQAMSTMLEAYNGAIEKARQGRDEEQQVL